jgi:hypothetical protein
MKDSGPTSDSDAGADLATAARHTRGGGVLPSLTKRNGLWVTAAGLSCAVAGLAWADTSAGLPSPPPTPRRA